MAEETIRYTIGLTGGCDSDSQNRHGKKKLKIIGKYKIVTTEEEYILSFSEWVKEYENSGKIEVYNLEIAKKTWRGAAPEDR